MSTRLAHLSFLLAVVGTAGPAAAADFDATTGMVTLTEGSLSWGFENLDTAPAELPVWLAGPRFDEVDQRVLIERFVYDDRVIEGQGAFAMGGNVYRAVFIVNGLEDRFADRRVEMSFWQRPEGTRIGGDVSWYAGDVDGAIASGDFRGLQPMGSLAFRPTGRVTDDGWMEMSTGPVDFMLAGALPPALLSLNDTHADGRWGNPSISFDPNVRALVDAFEIRDVGPAELPVADCSLANQTEACGEMAVCTFGRCAEAAVVVGPSITDADVRHDYLERRLFELRRFDGSRRAVEQMPGLEAAVASVMDETRPAPFWHALQAGVEQLFDGHASAPMPSYVAGPSTGACLALGEADLLPGAPLAPLVFFGQSGHPIGGQLQRGDALTAIDGLSVADWRAQAAHLLSYAGDPLGEEVVTTGQLLGAALQAGSTVVFERCPGVDAGGGCSGAVEQITIDLGATVRSAIWTTSLANWLGAYVACDFRFERVPSVQSPDGYATAASADLDGVRHLLFNGFPDPMGWGGDEWTAALDAALADGPARLVVDERTGYGGTVDGFAYASSFFLAPDDFYAAELYPQNEFEHTDLLIDELRACLPTADSFVPCGYFDQWRITDYPNDASGAASATRTAVLITSDVSGNDFFTEVLTHRAAETRIFGPTVTFGAFGPILGLPSYLGEASGGSFQILDTVFLGTSTDDPRLFTTGYGVPPDEVVHQKQSDALNGIDTLLEAAIAWVSQ